MADTRFGRRFTLRRTRRRALCIAAAGALASLACGRPAFAASATWSAAPTDGNWEAAPGEVNWSTGDGTFPGDISGATTNTDVATFNVTSGISNIAINSAAGNTSPLNLGSIGFSGASLGSFTIGSTSGNSLVTTSNTSTSTSPANQIFISGASRGSPTTAVAETINAPIVLAPQTGSSAGFYTFQNNSTVLSNGDALIFNGAVGGGTTTQGITLSLIGANTNANAVNGNITDGGAAGGVAVLKQGAGSWTLSGANSYSGGTSVTGGTLSITGSYSGTGTYQTQGGTLNINTAGTVTPANINFNGPSAVTLTAGTVQTAAVNSLAAGASNGRILNLNGGTLQPSQGVGTANGAFVVSFNGGTLKSGNPAGITFESTTTTTTTNHTTAVQAGGATLDTTIGNIASTALFNGTSGGAITVRGGHTFAAPVTNTGLLTIEDASTWDLGGAPGSAFVNSSVAGLSGNGSVVNSSTTGGILTLNFASAAGPYTYSGTIAPVAPGQISLVKSGTGTQTLAGSNTYGGGTSLSAGTLITANASALGAGAVNVTGGTLKIGDGSVDTVGGLAGLTISDGATLSLGGADSAITLASGNYGLGNITLDLNNLFNSQQTYTVIHAAANSTDSIGTVTFADADTTGFTYGFAVDPGTGNGVLTVTAVPEPAAIGLLVLGSAGFMAGRRRHRHRGCQA